MEQPVKKYKHNMIPVKPETFNKLDGMRRDMPNAAGNDTKKETWDSLMSRLVIIWERAGIS